MTLNKLLQLAVTLFLAFKKFISNKGFLLSGAIAYYALLSLIPFLILIAAAMTYFVGESTALAVLGSYLEWLTPSQASAVIKDVSSFLNSQFKVSPFAVLMLLFFSQQAFSALDSAMAVIFKEATANPRPVLKSVGLSYLVSAVLATALILIISVSAVFSHLQLFSKFGVSDDILYLVGITSEALIISFVYYVIPPCHISIKESLMAGAVVTAIWLVINHILGWYFVNITSASVVYGSLSTAVIVLFSLEIFTVLLLFGAQILSLSRANSIKESV